MVVDNTFASPFIQRPLALGADIVFHSATKYLAGHSDTVNGVLATSRQDLYERLRFLQNAIGAVPGPFDCFLVMRGLRTLGLRMERHSANAPAVAETLAARPDVTRVRFPGLASGPHAHPQAALAARQMALPGGMVSFEMAAADGRSPEERARRFCEATRLFTLAESLGGVESLCEVPAVMTHGSVQGSALEVPRSLVRLSVGIEDADDLVADVLRALDGPSRGALERRGSDARPRSRPGTRPSRAGPRRVPSGRAPSWSALDRAATRPAAAADEAHDDHDDHGAHDGHDDRLDVDHVAALAAGAEPDEVRHEPADERHPRCPARCGRSPRGSRRRARGTQPGSLRSRRARPRR